MPERILYPIEAEPRKTGLHAEFKGFSPSQEKQVRSILESTGLPNDDLKEVIKVKAGSDQKGVVAYCQPQEKIIGVTDNFDKIPAIGQFEAIPHEQAHLVSPFNPNAEKFYGSMEAMEASRAHVVAVAKQSLETKRYINGYQAHLAKQLNSGEIEPARFLEETSAILIGVRFTNPKHLEQVDAAQKQQLKKINPSAQPVDLLTSSDQANAGIVSGVDKTLVTLIPSLRSKADIDTHVAKLKHQFGEGINRPQSTLRLAA